MRLIILTFLLGIATLSGCAFPGVYKLNIQQGNIVTQEMLDQLEAGMTERQVIYIMGNPVVQSPYKTDKWEYIYTLERRDVVTKRYKITLYFDDQQLYSHYDGELPDQEQEKSSKKPIETEDELLPKEEINTIPELEE